jgi:hypothetical protein
VLVSVLVVLLFVQHVKREFHPLGSDLTSYLLSSQALLHGSSPWQTEAAYPYLYPIFLAFILIPLSLVPRWLSTALWFLANLSALAVAVDIVLGLALEKTRLGPRERWGLPLLALLVLLFNPIQNQMVNGQVNGIVLLCCVLFLKHLLRGRTLLASILLAAAISVKLFPLLLLAFVLFRRQYATAAITGVCTAIFCLAPAVLLGAHAVPIVSEYFHSVVVGGGVLSAQAHGHPAVFTLAGFVTFWFPAAANWPLLKPLSGLVVLSLLAVLEIHRLRQSRGDDGPAAAWWFCLYLTAMLLVVPMSEIHYQLFLIPAISLFGHVLWTDPGKLSRVMKGGFLLFFTFFYAGKVAKDSPFYFLAIAVLFAMLSSIVWRRRQGLWDGMRQTG